MVPCCGWAGRTPEIARALLWRVYRHCLRDEEILDAAANLSVKPAKLKRSFMSDIKAYFIRLF